jgi:hypothetical protein
MGNKLARFCGLAAVLLSIGCAARPIHAQAPQSITQNLFNSTACQNEPGGFTKSANVPNFGQSQHSVSYTITTPNGGLNIARMMASFDGTNFFQISDDGTAPLVNNVGILTANGSYPFLQFWVEQVVAPGTGCAITANYTGSYVSIPNPTFGQSDTTSYQKIVFNGQAANANQSVTFFPPYGSAGGYISFAFQTGTVSAGGTLTVGVAGSLSAGANTIASFSLPANTSLAQSFVVPAVPGAAILITYTSGGTGTATLYCAYNFTKPGQNVLPLGEKTVVVNTASAGPTQIIAVPLTGSARIVSIVLSSGTAEAIDLQQGTGTNCGTGNSQLTGLTHLAANTPWIQNFPGGGLVAAPGNAVCIHLSGANQTDGTITYSQY